MTALIGWMITYAVHSSVLLGLAWLVTRFTKERWALDESLWKVALCGGILTASLQLGLGVSPKLAAFDVAALVRDDAPAQIADAAPGRDVIVRDTEDALVVSEAPAAPAVTPPPWPHWSRLVVAAWLLGAAFGAWRLVHGWLSLARRLRRRRIVFSGPLLAELRALAGGDDVRLAICNALSVPIARGVWRREIVVPERIFELGPDEQRALLAHELGHLRRRDPAWRLLAELCRSLLWFQPLNWLAARQLMRLAELLCDDWAARRAGDRLALARCLSEVAAWLVTDRAEAAPAMAMAARRSELAHRVARLLDDGSPSRRRVPPAAGFAAAVLLAGVMWAAPGAAVTPGAERKEALATEAGALDESLERAIEALRGLRHSLRHARPPKRAEPPPLPPPPAWPHPDATERKRRPERSERWPFGPSPKDPFARVPWREDVERMIDEMLEDLPSEAEVERMIEEELRAQRREAERSLALAERRAAEASRKAEAARRAHAEAERAAARAKQRVERLRGKAPSGDPRSDARSGALRGKRLRDPFQ